MKVISFYYKMFQVKKLGRQKFYFYSLNSTNFRKVGDDIVLYWRRGHRTQKLGEEKLCLSLSIIERKHRFWRSTIMTSNKTLPRALIMTLCYIFLLVPHRPLIPTQPLIMSFIFDMVSFDRIYRYSQ